ncbi:MAG: Squalene epoxidase [Heterodermia speciosa]|uniref:Squalene monooxygenase n=1 Tax=Heterodermia speciosa TaxID=116794 RepID=A0A8H3EW46_9LECA|nr:MAG: Squalene epoxidase [Heterodermia speciosa]
MSLTLDSLPSSVPNHQHPATLDPNAVRRIAHHESDVVVVGAGILGTALAITFARQGRSVILLEKSLKEPDRIVGELLQPGGVEALKVLGLVECLEQIDAVKVKGYEVIYYGTGVEIAYPDNVIGKFRYGRQVDAGRGSADCVKSNSQARPEGRSFHHGRFIKRLRERALCEPNITVVESTVTGTVKNGWTGQVLGVTSMTKGEPDAYFGNLTVLADGYASRFRKEYISHTPVSKSKFWGLELIDADLPRPLHGHVVLGEGAPVLLYQIGSRETRALVDVPDGLESTSTTNGGVKGHLRNVVLPSLPKSVQPSFASALESGKLRSMPNSFLPPSTNRTPGLVILGDAMNMRHPLTGGGMTVAFNDVVLLRGLLSPETVPDLGNTRLVRQQMKTFHWQRKQLTSVINILAQALYSLFAANDPELKALQLGCFRYFQRGGQCIDGPVGLLAGIIRQPLVLFYHFFAVALLAIWLVSSKSSVWRTPLALASSVGIFWKACTVIFPFIFSEMRS